MKKSFVGVASLVSLLALSACSDDASSPKVNPADPSNPVVDPSNPTVDPSNPVVDPSNPTVDPSNPSTDPSVDLPDPNENIADKPISEEDKKDDGTASVGSLAYSVTGVAQFGPFVAGTPVAVSSVDPKSMVETPSASVKTTDKIGSFTATGTLASAIASFNAQGNFYDFVNNSIGGITSLKALSDLRERKSVNVNVLTHLEYFRVQFLMSGMGMNFTAAKDRAQKEITAVFGFKSDSTMFEDLNLYSMDESAERLLAVSSAFLYNGSGAETLLNAAASDIAMDGRWDDDASKAAVGDAAFNMDSDESWSNLSSHNNDADVRTFTGGRRNVWSAMYNLGSCSDQNRNEVKPNGNPKSAIQDKQFACKEGGWAVASAAFITSAAVAKVNGACDDSKAGSIVNFTDGKQYVCKKNMWSAATAADIAASQIPTACSSANEYAVAMSGGSSFVCMGGVWNKSVNPAIDYSKGRAMNKKLGRGVNFGNSWDAPGSDDGGWGNRIGDGDFAAVKAAGFNSVRLPVRWYTGMSSKISGVKADVQLAINAGLTVIVNNHHNQPVYDAAGNGSFESKLNDFKSEWTQVAQAFESFPDDAVVFEIFNEPHDMTKDQVKKLMTTGYNAIRAVSKGKTIMFEGNGYAKFAQIQNLDLPADGNIIVTGHYYDPYSFTHQGHGYDCNANANDGISAMASQFKSYADSIALYFPDVNGGSVPMNMGEFGVANKGSCSAVSDAKREKWTDAVLAQAEKYGMSWHYWCYKNCGGFEAGTGSSWHGNMLNVFKKYMQ
ncbi:MAG: cellulase family glycosylhydrolase [Fibrobacter sp.]|nr:cellulase family glycosylhydrolase [Fibrobacter sp.]